MQIVARLKSAPSSLALRIAAASALFGLVVACGVTAAVFWTLSQQLLHRSSVELLQKQELLGHIVKKIPSKDDIFHTTHSFDDLLLGHDNLHLAMTNASDEKLLASFSPKAFESIDKLGSELPDMPTTVRWRSTDGTRLVGLKGTLQTADGQAVSFHLSIDRKNDVTLITDFAKAALLAIPILLILMAAGAWVIARMALRPLRRFHTLAASVGSTSLSQRLRVSGLPDELAELATQFNDMLHRIDADYARLQEFSGNVAHEMRTPVATLLGRSQVALSQARHPDELRQVLEANIDEMERLARLIADMLLIASADAQKSATNLQPSSLADIAQSVVDFLSFIAEEKELSITLTGDATVKIDRLLVQRAITNLLSNAIRHATVNTTINVNISAASTGATLSVTNFGHGIATGHLDRIFERFYRVDSGRARGDGGTGLGLAIVRSIMSMHHGQVAVQSVPGEQTTFTLYFTV